ncbi:MAG: amidohydrolase family protein [Caldilineaceae bacterium]|nr:amidohydrolase family protein [Caldilineaceae bacterium]
MPPLALCADNLWDGQADTVQPDMAVIVAGATIEAIVPTSALAADLPRVALPGCTLLPGLIDAHVHYSDSMGAAFLAAGVTTIRDVGNDLAWILAQRARHAADPSCGPTIVCCGILHDGPRVYWQSMGRAHADAASLRASIRHHVEQGVDQIKLYASLDLGLLRAGVEEAHRHGKFILAHLGSTRGEDAAQSGLNEIEHLDQCQVAWRAATEPEDDDFIKLLLKHQVVIDPTLVVWDRLGRILDRAFHHDERRQWVHPCYLDIWNRYLSRTEAPHRRLRFQAAMPHLKRFLARAQAQGVVVALGTDTPFPHLIPGFSLHDELAMYVDAGLRPVDALRSATAVNAQVLGLGERVGQLRAGMVADMIAVQGNPLASIDQISQIERVMHAGQLFTPAALLPVLQRTFSTIPTDAITQDLLRYVNRG